MERRQYNRQPLDLPAILYSRKTGDRLCRLRDYCPGGLMVYSTDPLAGDLTEGQEVTVSFSHRGGTGADQIFQVRCKVARIRPHNIGTAFNQQLPAPLRTALETEVQRYKKRAKPEQTTAEPAPKVEDPVRKKVTDAICSSLDSHLTPLLEDLSIWVGNILTELSKESPPGKIRKAILEASDRLGAGGEELGKRIRGRIKDLTRRAPEGAIIYLGPWQEEEQEQALDFELLETGSFEKWLVVSSTATKSEDAFQDILEDIFQSSRLVLGDHLDRHTLPFGPAAICQLYFQESVHLLPTQQSIEMVFKLLQTRVLENLFDMYARILEHLKSHGITDIVHEERRRKLAELTRARKAHERRTAAEKKAPHAAAPPPGQPAPGASHATPMTGAGTAPGGTQAPPPDAAQLVDVNALAGDIGSLVQMLNLKYQMNPELQRSAEAAGSEPCTNDELVEALHALQKEEAPITGASLVERLEDRLDRSFGQTKPRGLTLQQKTAAESVSGLFSRLMDAPQVPEDTRDWLQSLEVPFLKLSLLQPTEISDETHPAREVINLIWELASDADDVTEGLQHILKNHVERIVAQFQVDTTVFEEVRDELNLLLHKRRSGFLKNVQRTIATQEGQQRILRNRLQVAGHVRKCFPDGSAPAIFIRLLQSYWVEVLVSSLLHEDEDDASTKTYFDSTRRLAVWLRGRDPQACSDLIGAAGGRQRDQVADCLAHGLEDTFSYDEEAAQTCAELQDILGGKVPDAADLEMQTLPELFPDEQRMRESMRLAADVGQPVVHQARHLNQGDRLIMKGNDGDVRRARFAWSAPDWSRLVFVDERGMHVKDTTMLELVDRIESGDWELDLRERMPALNQGIFGAMEEVSSGVTEQAARDPETGLLTRKSFERRLETALHDAKRTKRAHAFCYLDTDQFRVINNQFGHGAGDKFIHDVAALYSERAPEGSALGRLGGDEFGLLIENCPLDKALEIAEGLRQSVLEHRFEWQGEGFNASISVGLVPVDFRIADLNTLFRLADEACFSAKNEGRNRVKQFSPGEEGVSEQKFMADWITRIDRYLSQRTLRLRSQKIVPLTENDTHRHSEILLTVMSEDGKPGSPQDLVLAAEAYGRIRDVDRFVVLEVLSWIRANPDKLDAMGGMAVNLSADSMVDKQFLDFLVGELERNPVPRGFLCFEITETAAAGSLQKVTAFIDTVRELGCSFAIDDFGTGMASYSYLKELPVDYLKIDGSFIVDLVSSPADQAMVRSMNEVAHFLGFRTIAECVENDETLTLLREMGVDYAQGWGIERPVLLDT